ncbi:MAG: RDD family protein [Nitrospinae bacterium]|nr:RDD family protein [Nitrospinota bacterium]
MSQQELACSRCGLVNEGVKPGAKCGACGTALIEHAEDPYEGKTFGLDLNRLPAKEAALALARFMGKSGALAQVSATLDIAIARLLRKPRAIPILRGRLLRYRKANLAEESAVSKNLLKSVTAGLRDHEFIPVMDRAVQSVTPGVFERLFANKDKKLYAIATFEPGGKMDMEIIASSPIGDKAIAVTNRAFDWLDNPGKTTHRLPGASVAELMSAMEYRSPEKNRRGLKFSLKDFVAIIADWRESMFDNAESGRLIVKVKGEEKETSAKSGKPQTVTQCHYHAASMAVSLCSVCSKPLCLACGQRAGGKTVCKSCAPKETQDSSLPFDISGELTPAGFFQRAAIKVAEVVGLVAILTALLPAGTSAGSIVAFQFIAAMTFIAYFTIPMVAWGATPLQRLFGVAVVDVETGEIPQPQSALARTGYLFLSMFTFIPAIGYLPALRSLDRRGVHDRIAGTIVLTRSSDVKEKMGAVALALALIVCGLALKNGGADKAASIFGRAFGGMAPLGRVALDAKWKINGVTMAAYNGGSVAAGLTGGALTGIDIETGAVVWKVDGVKAQGVYADTSSGHYLFTGKKENSQVIGFVSPKDGAIVWTAPLERFSGVSPALTSASLAIADNGKIAAFSRTGKKIWSVDAGGKVASLTPAGEAFIAEVKGKGSVVFDAKTGAAIGEIQGTPATSGPAEAHVFAGRGWTKLAYFPRGKGREWTLARRLSFATDESRSGELYYARQMAVRASDGAIAFEYPAGCVCVGIVKKLIALSCPMQGKLLLADGASGRIQATFAAPAMDTVRLLGEEGGGRLLGTVKTQGGFTRAYVIFIKTGFSELDIKEAGEFRDKPLIVNLFDRGGLLLIAGDGGMGLYDPAPGKSGKKK